MSTLNPEFVDNPEPRCAVVLVLDTSGSMDGQPIGELNAGLKQLATDLREDALARLRVELAMVTFGGRVDVVKVGGREFVSPDDFNPPTLSASGETPMGQAVRTALQLLRARKNTYKQQGVDYFRPWLFLLTDGEPTDNDWQAAATEAREEEGRKGVLVFPIGVGQANMQKLSQFSAQRQPVRLQGLAFKELFTWMSKSLQAVASSKPGDQVPLPLPTGWASIDG
ncbi:MAG: VWA domain-containing protein [Candidatus Brachytrichaceae bacterium NZ_4S206]|jgi:uncharacterized protein YegL